MQAIIRILRDADWLDSARAAGYARLIAIMSGLGLLVLFLMSHGGVDPRGEPVGTDFSNFWSASKLALAGHPASVYDLAAQFQVQKQTFGDQTGFYPFFYPPIYLLICWPLALLPYLPALGLWIAATGGAYLAVIRRIGAGAIGILPVLAYPAVFVTIGHGQNAFLTTAILGAAILDLDRKPVRAGVLLGCLVFKPHLAVVAPIALIVAGRWRTLFAAGASALALGLASLAAFGLDTWKAFFASTPMAKAVLDDKLMGVEKLQSLFGAVRVLGGGAELGYVAQTAVALCAILVLVVLLRRSVPRGAQGALIATAAALTSPYFLDYDLALIAIPLAWATAQGLKSGFMPYEKSILAFAFALPGFSRAIAGAWHLPLAPLAIGLLFWAVTRRAAAEAAQRPTIAMQPLAAA